MRPHEAHKIVAARSVWEGMPINGQRVRYGKPVLIGSHWVPSWEAAIRELVENDATLGHHLQVRAALYCNDSFRQ
jgi:hypothetical protein